MLDGAYINTSLQFPYHTKIPGEKHICMSIKSLEHFEGYPGLGSNLMGLIGKIEQRKV